VCSSDLLAGLENTTGTTIYVSAGEPATYDVAGFEALTWSQVVGTVSFGEWGDSEADVSEPLLSEGRVIHTNGASDGGEVSIVIQKRTTDAGADILETKGGTNDSVSFKKIYGESGDGEYGVGVVTSAKQREAGSDTVRGFTQMARINTKVYKYTAAEIAAA